MRSESEVRQRIDKLLAEGKRQLSEEFLSKTTRNCVYNTLLRVKDHGMTGFCQNPKVLSSLQCRVFVCNNDDVANGCGCFQCRNTEETVEERFLKIIRSPALCGEKYPKLAILLWMIQRFSGQTRKERLKGIIGDLMSSLRALLCMKWW